MSDHDAPPPPPRAPSLTQRALYWCVWNATLLLLTIVYRLRRFHTERIPRTGPVLLIANHQSHLDPPSLSMCVTRRQTHFLARAGLFSSRAFGWLIRSLNAVPIKEESGDLGAIRAILARLETGVPVLMFPEGSRSFDGAMQPFKRGVALLLRRARCPVVPMAIEGAFDAFPRQARVPSFWGKRVAVAVGHPIAADELLKDGPDAALDRLQREVDELRRELRARLRASSGGRYPRSGPADAPAPQA